VKSSRAIRRLVAILGTTSVIVACGEHTIELWSDESPVIPEGVPDAGTIRPPVDNVFSPVCPITLDLDAGLDLEPELDAGDDGGNFAVGCELRGAVCEYGNSPDPECNPTYACATESAPWRLRPNAPCFAAVCPKNVPTSALEGKPCTLDGGNDNDEAICTLDDGTCACTTGAGAADHHERSWRCTKPIFGCPIARPNVGQPCGDDIICDYGSCPSKRGAAMKCAGGVWEATSFTCAL